MICLRSSGLKQRFLPSAKYSSELYVHLAKTMPGKASQSSHQDGSTWKEQLWILYFVIQSIGKELMETMMK